MTMKRRDFLKLSATAGAATLVLGSRIPFLGIKDAFAATQTLEITITDCMKQMVTHNQINDARLYRGLDVLRAHKEKLCAHLLERYRDWFGVQFEFLLYDVTSKIRRSTDMQTILTSTATELSKALGARRTQIRLGTVEPAAPSAPPPQPDAPVTGDAQ